MVHRKCVLAMGVLYECAVGSRGPRAFVLAGPGKQSGGGEPRRLDWRSVGNRRFDGSHLWIHRIFLPGLDEAVDMERVSSGGRLSDCVYIFRGSREFPDGSLRPVSILGF